MKFRFWKKKINKYWLLLDDVCQYVLTVNWSELFFVWMLFFDNLTIEKISYEWEQVGTNSKVLQFIIVINPN